MEAISACSDEDIRARKGGPYVGPRPFEGGDKMFFFGREREARELANMVAACALTVVYGPSGAGKSSLLNAKLLDELAEIEPDWIPVAFSQWQRGFESALVAALDDKLERDPDGSTLDRYPQMLQVAVRTTRSPIVLVFDQFEEYFLYHGTGALAFEVLLAQLANGRERGVHVVLSLRSDRLFLLDSLRRRIPHILQNLFLIDPLNAGGAVDAIRKPIALYNKRCKLAVGVEPALVDALVRGADEQQILQRLPFRGRGKAPSAVAATTAGESPAGSDGRIVAPFLQLALEALWVEDIEECGGTLLTLSTLRVLARAPRDASDDNLVGLLAQQRLDIILFHRPEAEQAVCAIVFDRMVTYSGGKVAVEVPGDFTAVLDPEQQRVAAALLDDLSAPGPDCLVRRVASDSQRQYGGQPDAVEERFEIVHDALAVPILDWVTRWREEQARIEAKAREQHEAAQRAAIERGERESREAQRAAKRRIWRWVLIAATTVAVAVPLLMQWKVRADMMGRIAAYDSHDTQPQYRLRLLLGLASLSQADGPWNTVLKKKSVRASLRNTLLRSPHYGGTYRGAGLDDTGTQFANVGSNGTQLQVLSLRDGAVTSFDLPPELSTRGPSAQSSRSQMLQRQQATEVLVGYLAGLDGPVVLSRGMLYYRSQELNDAWRSVDLADFMPPWFDAWPGFFWTEISAGAVQIAAMSQTGNEMHLVRLRPAMAPDGTLNFTNAVRSDTVQWPGQRFQPALSPWLDEAPHDRFAYLRLTEPSSAGQLTAPALMMGDLTTKSPDPVIWEGVPARSDERTQEAMAAATPPSPPSVAFTADRGAIVMRFGAKIVVVPLKGSAPPEYFDVPDVAQTVAPARRFMRPLIAAVKVAEEPGHPAFWRFAWLDAPDATGGVVVLDAGVGDDEHKLHIYHPWSNRANTLLPGFTGAYGLTFSRNGAFLILQQLQWSDRSQQVRIWDLRLQWQEQILAAKDDATLKQLACKLAGIEPNGAVVHDDERAAWLDGSAAEPCAP
jgi:hypothetical protein